MIDNSMSKAMVEEIIGKPGTIVAYRKDGRPIYNIAGGSVDFTDTDTDDDDSYDPHGDDTDDDDDDDDDDKEGEFTPPTKEQWEKLLADKKKADSESAARKRLLREHGINPKDGTPLKKSPPKLSTSDDDDTSVDDNKGTDKDPKRTVDNSFDAKELERRLQREMERNLLDQETEVRKEERDRSRTLMVAIPEALNGEGWNGKALPRILKLLDLDSIEIDNSDGEIEGLDDQVTELKKDFPEFFKRTRMKEAAEKVADRKTAGGGNKKTSSTKTEGTWAENIARALHGDG